MDQERILLIILVVLVAGNLALYSMVKSQRLALRALNMKLAALLKAQGVEWPALSPEVQSLALDPRSKIAAIKRYRDENPGIGLVQAKNDIEAFAENNRPPAARRI
jgi:ribosomal protein L7/L12